MKIYQKYSNEDLVDLLVKGDESAFSEIYNRYWKKIYVIAYNRLKEAELSEDIAHDVFVSLWANRQKVKIEALENYLATATKYLVLGIFRKRELARRYNTANHKSPSVLELPIETSLHYKLILERVKLEVEKLPEKCRIIFNYSRNDGMAVKQIAKELNVSPKTVENQINKAIKQLRLATKALTHLWTVVLFFY